jgi:hypothetical protein
LIENCTLNHPEFCSYPYKFDEYCFRGRDCKEEVGQEDLEIPKTLKRNLNMKFFLLVDICEQCCEATQSAFLMRQRLKVIQYVVLFGQVHFLSCTACLCFSEIPEGRIPVTRGLVCPCNIWPGLYMEFCSAYDWFLSAPGTGIAASALDRFVCTVHDSQFSEDGRYGLHCRVTKRSRAAVQKLWCTLLEVGNSHN